MTDPRTTPSTGDERFRPWLNRFAVLFVAATFGLILLGGTVTSKGVGLAVPDWPTSYEYNMFLFPLSMWKGGVFWEHLHRLAGSAVGMLAIGMAVALWTTQKQRPWLRGFGLATLVLVIVQGIMGGLRVTEIDERWGIVHGVTGQVFLCMTVTIAVVTGRWWQSRPAPARESVRRGAGAGASVAEGRREIRRLALGAGALLGVLMVQLTLGAAMRHLGAGVAIPDFPTSFGQVLPPFSQPEIDTAFAASVPWDMTAAHAPHAGGSAPSVGAVALHFAHRAWAVVVLAVAMGLAALLGAAAWQNVALRRAATVPAATLLVLLMLQVALGASVIWTGRHPEVATAHQATGATILAIAAWLTLRLLRLGAPSLDREACDADRADAVPPASGFAVEGGMA